VTAFGWIVIGALVLVVGWLGLALVGLVRDQAVLRARIEHLEATAAPLRLDSGLAVGRRAPAWSITTPNDEVVTSASLAGLRHLLVFADADCRACDELVPGVVRASTEGALPPVVIVGRGEAASMPSSWRVATAGVERGDEVSAAFDVEATPHVFVVDDGGAVVAQGGAVDLHDVEELVTAGQGITIVRDADA
jgi:hypothetical protein